MAMLIKNYQWIVVAKIPAAWSSGRTPACCAEGGGSNPGWGSPRIFNTVFHQQKLSSLSIACDVKLKGALYSVFYAEASKRP